MQKHRFAVLAVAALALAVPGAAHALQINPDYDSFTGTELDVLKDAVSEWAVLLPCNDGMSITINFSCDNNLSNSTLGETKNWVFDDNGHITSVDIVMHNDRLYWTLTDPSLWDNSHKNDYDALYVAKHELGHALGWTVGAALFSAHVVTDNGNRFYDMNDDGHFNDNDFDLVDNTSIGTHSADNTDLMYAYVQPATRYHPTLHHAQVLADAFGYCVAPEPATMLLVGLGTCGLAWMRRRRVR